MRIACCFSGQVRNFDLVFPSLQKHILCRLGAHELHFFAHYPIDQDRPKLACLNFTKQVGEDESQVGLSSLPDLASNDHLVAGRRWHQGGPYRAYVRQLRGIHVANELRKSHERETGHAYDWVLRLRYDNLYLSDIEAIESLDPNALYIPMHDNWGGYNDRFAFCSAAIMDVYCSRYTLLEDFLSRGRKLNPEPFLKWVIDAQRIEVRRTTVVHHLMRYGEVWKATYRRAEGDVVPKGMDHLFTLPPVEEPDGPIFRYLRRFRALVIVKRRLGAIWRNLRARLAGRRTEN